MLLFNLGHELNGIYFIFTKKLELPIQSMDVELQKINNTILDIDGIIVTAFLISEKENRVRFFEKTFLLTNVSPKIVFGILSLTLSSVDINFLGWKLW